MKNFLSSDPHDITRALQEQNRSMEEREAQANAQSLHLPYVNLQNFPLDLQILGLFTEQEAIHAESVPFFREGHDLRIATVNPRNPLLTEKTKVLSEKYKISLYFISQNSLKNTIAFYKKVATPTSQFHETVQLSKQESYFTKFKDFTDEAVQQKTSATELLALLFGGALELQASDIHLEPEDHIVKVRFRVDGALQDVLHIAKTVQKPITSRIKILSKLKLNIENEPQDGRLSVYRDSEAIDIRVSTLPSAYGEAIVMRLLGVGATNLKLVDLGFRGKAAAVIDAQLHKPNGMIITTGPTGSGKTTTLYAFLNELNEPGVKIITLEDPVEYKLEGIQQTPIDHNVDFDFAKGLRAILRQDPDIVMVGEIRDPETAETALQASLTGHVVLSTLHTNDAAGAVPRLITMGVKPFVIAPGLNAIIAQRLVRKLCPACKGPAQLAEAVLAKVKKILASIPKQAEVSIPKEITLYHSAGCSECHGLGYKGRIGVYEVIEVTDIIRELIMKDPSSVQMKKEAEKQGSMTMTQDGLLKALEGITDVEEVFRVVGE